MDEPSSVKNELRLPCQLGPFKVVEFLGGDMGAVYKAHDENRSCWVALKILPATLQVNTESKGRFQREAQAASRLSHPNLVQFYETGQLAGRQYISMEFVEGISLEAYLARAKRLSERRALKATRAIGRGLQHLHENGIIHRDLKPANIMVDSRGIIRVADLGLSKLLDEGDEDDDEQECLTAAGFVVGTPTYMSPEMAMGLPDIDHRADIYSLGVCMFEMLCGRPPFQGQVTRVLMSQIEVDVPSPKTIAKEVSDATCELVGRMTQKDPNERMQEVNEIIEAIEEILPTVERK